MKITRDGKTITIECPDTGAADHLEVALNHRQWIQFDGRGVRLAQTDEEPKVSDIDLLAAGRVSPCFRPGGEPHMTVDKRDRCDEQFWSCYVQHIGARFCRPYDQPYQVYFQRMVTAGFVLLRSPRDAENKYWEIWYLPGAWHLNGALKNITRKELTKWLHDYIGPGTHAFDGERWALTFD